MSQGSVPKDKFSQLREKAEHLLSKGVRVSEVPPDTDPQKLIQELQTHQIELEMQNEELLRSQQEFMESKIEYTQLYDFAPVGYITINSNGIIQHANLTFAEMLSIERSRLIYMPLSACIEKEDQDMYYHYKRGFSQETASETCELRLKRHDGGLLDVRMTHNIHSADIDDTQEYKIAIIDISDQKKAEKEKEKYRIRMQQTQKMEAIGTLAGGIAHDFNNILYPIMGFAQLSIDELPDDHPVQENLEDILCGTKRARDLVKQILAFSHPEKNERIAIDPNPMIKEILKFLRSTIPANIEIKHELCNSDECILTNTVDMHEIIMNLCTNAYHAMEETGGELNVKLDTIEDSDVDPSIPSGNFCCLSVSDTGAGIPPDIIENIFEPYFTTKEIGKGSGLGLSIVHGLVKKHKGAITVKSEPEKGTVFHVYLPIAQEPITTGKTISKEPIRGGNERILFLDDEQTIVKFGIRFLESLGYQVTGEVSSADAFEKFVSDPYQFDLVITDMAMPDMTGKELTLKMIEIRPDIPIIMCTGYSDQMDAQIAQSMGIKGFINKPLLGDNMAIKIRNILDEKNDRIE